MCSNFYIDGNIVTKINFNPTLIVFIKIDEYLAN